MGATQVYALSALEEFDLFINDLSISNKNIPVSLHGKVLYIEDTKPVIPEGLEARVRNLILNKKLLDTLESKQAYLENLALTDQLTGLKNRHYLFEVGEMKLRESARHKFPLCALVFDVDHFKKINDEHGHQVGDQVLAEMGDFLNERCRQEDLITRTGGEEFVMLLSYCNLKDAVQKAEFIREKVEDLRPADIRVTISIGVCSYDPDAHTNLEALISAADTAAYQAKSAGRNQVVAAGSEADQVKKADHAA
jgi:two-component system cell cycle response regulator